jgi:inosine-uridine nucleoside N-ribohydrolase
MYQDGINLIVDTDIGPDCDDAAALALLHILARKKKVRFLAMTNCTSNPYGCGTIDVINRYYDHEDIPVGGYAKEGFLQDTQKYNKYITENYDNRYKPPISAPNALQVLKKALSTSEDTSVTMLSIGPLNNLADLVKDEEGYDLIQQKVIQLVSMATAQNPGNIEWNIRMDIPAATTVCKRWPTPVVLSPMEIGTSIITMKNFGRMKPEHPVRVAYRLYRDDNEAWGYDSHDLIAAWYAVMGTEPFFQVSDPCDISILNDGRTLWKEQPGGKFRFLHYKMNPEKISEQIDALWF